MSNTRILLVFYKNVYWAHLKFLFKILLKCLIHFLWIPRLKNIEIRVVLEGAYHKLFNSRPRESSERFYL